MIEASLANPNRVNNPENNQEGTDLRIISWNAAGNINFNPQTIEGLDEFSHLGADIIFLQETGLQTGPNGEPTTIKQISQKMSGQWNVYYAGYRSGFVEQPQGADNRFKDEGSITMLFREDSPVIVEKVYSMSLKPNSNPNIFEKVKSIRGGDDRMAQIAVIQIKNKRLAIVNLHLDWQGGAKQRQAQLASLGDQISHEETDIDGFIIMGDFNIPGQAEAKNSFKYVNTNAFGRKFDDMIPVITDQPTVVMGGLLKFKPDMAIVSQKIKKSKLTTLTNSHGSDHLPIALDIGLF